LISYIWFDLGYTLVNLNREEVYQQKLHKLGIVKSLDEIALAYHLTDKYFMREFPGLLGKDRSLFADQYFNRLNNNLNLSLTKSDWASHHDDVKPQWHAFEKTIPTLKALKEKGLGVGLISNWDQTARTVLDQNHISGYLDHIVISSEVKIEKPDERIFLHALEQAKVKAEECLYVGDNYYDDVVGSKKVGMASILINPYQRVGIEELSEQVPIIANISELLPTLMGMDKQLGDSRWHTLTNG